MILRPDYINAVTPFTGKPLVKILAGVRRCGKSTIFEMLREELLRRGVSEDCIIQKRYTEMDIPENITARTMYDQLGGERNVLPPAGRDPGDQGVGKGGQRPVGRRRLGYLRHRLQLQAYVQ